MLTILFGFTVCRFVRIDEVIFMCGQYCYTPLKDCPEVYEKLTDEQKLQIEQLPNNNDRDLFEFIKKDLCRIKHISDPSYNLQKFVVSKSSEYAQYIKNLNNRLQRHIVTLSVYNIEYIQNIDTNVLSLYLKLEPFDQKERLIQTKKCLKILQIERFKKSTPTLDHLSKKEKLKKVKEDGYNIAYITKPSKKLINIAIETTPRSVLFVKNVTHNQLYRAMLSLKKEYSKNHIVFSEHVNRDGLISWMNYCSGLS